jgi:glucokinase
MHKYLGVDLGGTRLSAAVLDTGTGEVSVLRTVPTLAREGHAAVVERMAGLIESVIGESGLPKDRLAAIGIGVPGMLDLERGRVLFLPNLPGNWPDVPLQSMIAERLCLPTYLLNDARSMTLGEWAFGAGRDVDDMACFTVGTGIGGGLVIGGKLHLGIGGTGGELGHQIIDMHGPPCGCGSRGCLEAFASGSAITAMGLKAVTQGLTTHIGEMVDYDLNRINPEVIARAAQAGDEIANDIYQRAGFYLGIAVSNVLTAVGPRKVVIGGGVAQAGELLFEPIRRTVAERVHLMPKEKVQILPAQLGTNAGLIGAALWAHQQNER